MQSDEKNEKERRIFCKALTRITEFVIIKCEKSYVCDSYVR